MMNTILKHKKAISLFFVFTSVLFLFLTLLFYVAKTEVALMNVTQNFNAFNILGGDLNGTINNGLITWVNVFTVTLLVVFAIEIAAVAYCLVKKTKSKNIFAVIVVLNILLTVVYMINGIAVSNQLEKYFVDYLEEYLNGVYGSYGSYGNIAYSVLKISTSAFVPFILADVSAAGYLTLEYLPILQTEPQNETQDEASAPTATFTNAQTEAQDEAATAKAAMGEEQTTELLLKYKRLLDQGVITQEEFDKKKTTLLEKTY